jgi:hypothetical protein
MTPVLSRPVLKEKIAQRFALAGGVPIEGRPVLGGLARNRRADSGERRAESSRRLADLAAGGSRLRRQTHASLESPDEGLASIGEPQAFRVLQ